MLARLVHKADFESLMAAPTWSRSAHFALHHLPKGPAGAAVRRPAAGAPEISTDSAQPDPQPVDIVAPTAVWFGVMVPKRHARRAVTRNLLKRQIRAAFGRHEPALQPGLWLVRLRGAFASAEFPAAHSAALAAAARAELDDLLRGARPPRNPPRPPSARPAARPTSRAAGRATRTPRAPQATR